MDPYDDRVGPWLSNVSGMWTSFGHSIHLHVVLKSEKHTFETRIRITIIVKSGIFNLGIVYLGIKQIE